MPSKAALESEIRKIIANHGEWAYDIPLPHNIWTRGNEKIPHARLKRIVQIIHDCCRKPIDQCRILDLGCLEGIFSIEFAMQGADVTGVEIRESNIKKAKFCRDVLKLDRLTLVQDDVRNISPETLGEFDVILCSGLLYHLPARGVFQLISMIYAMTTNLAIIDTHISLKPIDMVSHNSKNYYGHFYREHSPGTSMEVIRSRLWASVNIEPSFWLSRPSLMNCLSDAGFSSIHECYNPPYMQFGKAQIEYEARCTFVAVKGETARLHTSPLANDSKETWPEGSLAYPYEHKAISCFNEMKTALRHKVVGIIRQIVN